jgi:hypothetical protein
VAVSSSGNHDNNIYNQWWGETHNGVSEVEKKAGKKEDIKKEDVRKDDLKKDDLKKQDLKKDSLDREKVAAKTFKAEVEKNQDLAKNLKGHLLLVTGDIDNNVHPGNTLRVVDALIKANKRFDFMILPGQRHGYGNETAYFDRLMWYYFAEHLLGDYRTNVELTGF